MPVKKIYSIITVYEVDVEYDRIEFTASMGGISCLTCRKEIFLRFGSAGLRAVDIQIEFQRARGLKKIQAESLISIPEYKRENSELFEYDQ